MKNILISAIISIVICWSVGYGLTCLVSWELLNPVNFIIKWPEYSVDDRAGILISLSFPWILVFWVAHWERCFK